MGVDPADAAGVEFQTVIGAADMFADDAAEAELDRAMWTGVAQHPQGTAGARNITRGSSRITRATGCRPISFDHAAMYQTFRMNIREPPSFNSAWPSHQPLRLMKIFFSCVNASSSSRHSSLPMPDCL